MPTSTLDAPFPDGFFGPPSTGWPDTPDVRRCLGWLLATMPPVNWTKRREAACRRLYSAASGGTFATEHPGGRFFDDRDAAGWYLFLAEAFLDHPWNYEPMYGSRVLPVLAALGRDLDTLQAIKGVPDRVSKLIFNERAQPNGILFEMLVALQYAKRGAVVRFVPETKGKRRSHDLDVQLGGVDFAVECKRMEVGDYGDQDRMQVRKLWCPLSEVFTLEERSVLARVRFKRAVRQVPYEHLRDHANRFVRGGERPIEWDDHLSIGSITALDLRPLRKVLRSSMVLASGSRMSELLLGEYVRHVPLVTSLRIKPAANPRYADDCDLAVVLRWETDAPADLDGRARDVQRKLFEANDQLPNDRPGVVHIGFEAVDGDRVEALRFDKIRETLGRFDPRGKPLEHVYTHSLVPESPPDQAWAYEETTYTHALKPRNLRPLPDLFLVTPESGDRRPGPHWA